jgi:hypothetical protein
MYKVWEIFSSDAPNFLGNSGLERKVKACKQLGRLKVHPLGTIDSLDHGEFYRTP